MPPKSLQSTPTKPTRPGSGDESLFSPSSPSQFRYSPRSPIRFRPGTPNDDAKEIAERRRARQSMTPTKPVARLDSICQGSKVILNDMAGMFSPKKETLEVSPFKIEVQMPPTVPPANKEQSGRDRRDDQRRRQQGQVQRTKDVNPGRIRRRTRPPADPAPEESTSKRLPCRS